MFELSGKIKLVYLGETKTIDYTFNNLADTPLFSFRDKRGNHHQFIKVFGKWQSRLNVQPKWRPDFIEVLREALEHEFLAIYASNMASLKGINGVKY